MSAVRGAWYRRPPERAQRVRRPSSGRPRPRKRWTRAVRHPGAVRARGRHAGRVDVTAAPQAPPGALAVLGSRAHGLVVCRPVRDRIGLLCARLGGRATARSWAHTPMRSPTSWGRCSSPRRRICSTSSASAPPRRSTTGAPPAALPAVSARAGGLVGDHDPAARHRLLQLHHRRCVHPGTDAHQQDLVIWTPDALGSICFLISSQLAFAEVGHRWISWRPHEPGLADRRHQPARLDPLWRLGDRRLRRTRRPTACSTPRWTPPEPSGERSAS